jgi:hypothetical protein
MKCPKCGRGLSQKYRGVEHYKYFKRKYRKLQIRAFKRIMCDYVQPK